MATGVLALASCSDTWKDHYDDSVGAAGISYPGNTMSYIQSKPELSNFAEVLKSTGFDARLSGDQKLTVWAPVNGSFNMDSLRQAIAIDKDNVIKTFVQNHVALYNLSIGDRENRAHMLNTKTYELPAFTDSINGVRMSEKNISCTNGVAHIVESPIIYRNNIYEQIEAEYKEWLKAGHEAPTGLDKDNLYSYLASKDSMILDENRSIANGVDEYGNRLYIDTWYERYNEALDYSASGGLVNAGALIYEEDSSYIAIIPSPEAYKARYELAKSLLKFHPKDSRAGTDPDSLAREYANRFATYDLFYSNSINVAQKDSLVSSVYGPLRNTSDAWYNHVYYREQPIHALPEGKTVNDIIAEGRYTKRIECSNGVAYVVDEYPMSAIEQFFYPLHNLYAYRPSAEQSYGVGVSTMVSYQVPSNIKIVLRDSVAQIAGRDTTVQYLDTVSGSTDIYSTLRFTHVTPVGALRARPAYELTGTLSGKYRIKIVTAPVWASVRGFMGANPLATVSENNPNYRNSKARYQFEAYIFEKGVNGDYSTDYSKPTAQLKASAVPGLEENVDRNGDMFLSHSFKKDENGDSVVCMLDTITLGEYDFKYSYHGAAEGGVLLQIHCNVTDVSDGMYAKDILIHKFILEPVLAEEKKSKGGK